MYDLIILGGGPAGLAASVYAARKRINTLLLSQDIGGQVNWTTGVENYLGYQFIEGRDLIAKFQEQVDQFPITQKIGYKAVKVQKLKDGFEVTSESGDVYQSKALIVATGKRPRRLNIPGEVELTGRGVTYCAVCDGPIFTGQRVAVIGGGNSALEAALDMVKIAEWVEMVSLTPLTGDAVLIEKLQQAKNLTLSLEYQTERVLGTDLVEGLMIKNIKTGEFKKLDVTGIFIEIGLSPNADAVKDLLPLTNTGEIPISCGTETGVPGLFAAGDVTNVPEKQIVIAAGEGAKAALAAHRFLQRL
ncbi:MAG: FAD-dependent oxidoreductase [Dehalococcoidales bacterium]|nr:FAD-dependent oxidoreductase [Dehalococcoidales bacterium]